jgi:hypothetical protein
MVKYIGTDEEVAQVQAHQPMQQTPDFIRAMLRLSVSRSTCRWKSSRRT